jgi:membrane-associated phospholipid phosphatase
VDPTVVTPCDAPRSDSRPQLLVLLAVLIGVYLLSLAGLLAMGRRPAVPWSFVQAVVLVWLPLAVILVTLLGGAPPRLLDSRLVRFARIPCIAIGVGATYLNKTPGLWLAVCAVIAVVLTQSTWTRGRVTTLSLAMLAMVVGFASVWNLNCLVALFTAGRLDDAWFVAFDLRVFSAVGLSTHNYVGLLPLVSAPWLLRLLENSYLMLFPELLVALIFLAATQSMRDVARWLAVLFSAYATGLVVFFLFPAVGPFTYVPNSIRPDFQVTFAFTVMQSIANDYSRLLNAGALTGFGYFVAMPSLHVAAATLAQRSLRTAPLLYWAFIPVNCLLAASTVLLGFHYLLDLPAGFFLAVALARVLDERAPRIPAG